jgi:uncharacterized protein (DUF58 family)
LKRFHPEALLFCLAWTGLAFAAALMIGIWTGILFSAGFALVLMPLSATIVSKTEDFDLERKARWGLLLLSALCLSLWITLRPAGV